MFIYFFSKSIFFKQFSKLYDFIEVNYFYGITYMEFLFR